MRTVRSVVAEVLFLGTGNAFSPPGRMPALALIDGSILIDVPPTVLPQLRKAGIAPTQIRHLLITHWHADHIFGFPFLMLDREKMGAINNERGVLEIHCQPRGKGRMVELCNVGFPGSLDEEIAKRTLWEGGDSNSLNGTEWSYERFPVCHNPETDPHGYKLVHRSGITILHCGDSGPCESIEERAPESDVVILEMGVPDFVKSPHHHNPSDVADFKSRHSHAIVLVTHNFAKSPGLKEGFDIPELPEGVVQLNDGDRLEISDVGQIKLIRN